MEVRQEVVRVRLRQVAPVEVETEEHDERPEQDLNVNLADEALERRRAMSECTTQ